MKPLVRFAIQAGLWVNFFFYLATAIAIAVWYIPCRYEFWILDVSGSRCRHPEVMSYAQGIFGVVCDIYIVVLPMPTVWTLNLPRWKKAGIPLIFATGFLYVYYTSASANRANKSQSLRIYSVFWVVGSEYLAFDVET